MKKLLLRLKHGIFGHPREDMVFGDMVEGHTCTSCGWNVKRADITIG